MKREASAASKKCVAREILTAHLYGSVYALKELKEPTLAKHVKRLPPANQAKHKQKYADRISEYSAELRRRLAIIRKTASYLGLSWNVSRSSLLAAQQVRRMVKEGFPDETIALYLEKYLFQSLSKKGRSVSVTKGDLALRALETYMLEPSSRWQDIAPKVCARHNCAHGTSCVERIKQDVGSLRKFLKTLGAEGKTLRQK